MSAKSEYSYLQYHWCPMALSVILGCLTSSVKYSSRSDGRAKNRRIIAGRIVQIVSICWASMRYRCEYLLIIKVYMAYPTTVITNVRIISVWSWNEIS